MPSREFTCDQTMTYRFATIHTDLVVDNSDEDRFDNNSFRHLHVAAIVFRNSRKSQRFLGMGSTHLTRIDQKMLAPAFPAKT